MKFKINKKCRGNEPLSIEKINLLHFFVLPKITINFDLNEERGIKFNLRLLKTKSLRAVRFCE